MSKLSSSKSGNSAPQLKKSQDDLRIGDNIFVKRSISSREEIYVATIIEVKRVRDSHIKLPLIKTDFEKSYIDKVFHDELTRGLNF